VLIRQNGPVFGPSEKPYMSKGTWQLNAQFRMLRSDDHYNGTVYQEQRDRIGNYVINKQKMLDIGVTYALTERLNLSLAVPVVAASWSLPSPSAPVPGPRYKQEGHGIGDLSLSGRFWLFSTESTKHNIQVGLGIKLPTGNSNAKSVYPDFNTKNLQLKSVDISAQPGDGGTGAILDVQGFQVVNRVFFFGGFTYLVNPRDTNNTPSIISGLGLGSNPAYAGLLVNSVPDQYMLRGGAAVPVPKIKGLSASMGVRMEGLPRYDLIGASHGWRRPGRAAFMEPGLLFTRGNYAFNLNVPVTFYRNRMPNAYTNAPGDATFPEYIVLAGVSYRFKK
jgi:hypothetical protein